MAFWYSTATLVYSGMHLLLCAAFASLVSISTTLDMAAYEVGVLVKFTEVPPLIICQRNGNMKQAC